MNLEQSLTDWARKHEPVFIKSHHVHSEIHGGGLWGRFNAAAATRISGIFTSMNFFWFCVVLDVVELVALLGQPFNIVNWVSFLSQTVIQLLALPVLGVMGNLQQQTSDAQSEAMHTTLKAVHELALEIDKLQEQQMNILQKLK